MYISLLLKQKVWGQDQKQFIAIKRLEQMYAWLHANTFVKRNKINNNYLPFSKRMTLHLSCTYACFLPSLVKIGIMCLKSKILKMCQCISTKLILYTGFLLPQIFIFTFVHKQIILPRIRFAQKHLWFRSRMTERKNSP